MSPYCSVGFSSTSIAWGGGKRIDTSAEGATDANQRDGSARRHGDDARARARSAAAARARARALGEPHLDARVIFRGEGVEDQVAVLVYSHQVRRLERLGLDQPDDRQEDRLARRRLDHDALALAVGVEVDGGAVVLGLLLGVHVEDLDNVGDQVGQLPVQLDLLVVLLDLLLHARVLVPEPRRLVAHHFDLVVEQARARDELVVGHRCDLVPHVVVRLAKDDVIRRRHGGWRQLP
jgi:hypothetical protein